MARIGRFHENGGPEVPRIAEGAPSPPGVHPARDRVGACAPDHGGSTRGEPEETETVRRQIRALLEEGPLTAKEISSAVRRPEREIAHHLEHLRKSLHSVGRRLSQIPAECRKCGFVFRKRDRLKAPGRCPVCKGEAIADPSFRVEEG